MTTTGRGIINAPVDFEAAANVSLPAAGDVLELNNTTNYRGGTYTGAGSMQQDGVANVLANTTIDVNTFDWDGSVGATAETNISAGVTLTLNVNAIDIIDGYDGTVNVNSGRLTVNTPGAWSMEGSLNLTNTGGGTPTLNGSQMNVAALGDVNVSGGAAVVNASVVNNGTYAVAGSAVLQQNGSFTNTNSLTIAPGSTMNVNAPAAFAASSSNSIRGTLNLLSMATFNGGSYTSTGEINQSGVANIVSTTRINVDTIFRNGSTTNIAGGTELQMERKALILAGANMLGPGRLRNLATSTMILADTSQVSTVLINEGVVQIGTSPGIASVNDFAQANSGLLDIEIGGLTPAIDHDWLRVGNDAFLAGELSVSLINLFSPSLGDDFRILTASNVNGTFDSHTLPPLGGGLGWDVLYNPGDVTLSIIQLLLVDVDFDDDGLVDCADIDGLSAEIAAATNDATFDLTGDGLVNLADLNQWLADAATFNGFGSPYKPGDASLDGFVDVTDFNVWNSNKFTANTAWCSGNFNADSSIDVSDFNSWNANKFTASDTQLVPEPSILSLLLIAAIGLLAKRRDR